MKDPNDLSDLGGEIVDLSDLGGTLVDSASNVQPSQPPQTEQPGAFQQAFQRVIESPAVSGIAMFPQAKAAGALGAQATEGYGQIRELAQSGFGEKSIPAKTAGIAEEASKFLLPQNAPQAYMMGAGEIVGPWVSAKLSPYAARAGQKISESSKALVEAAERWGVPLTPADISKTKFMQTLEAKFAKWPGTESDFLTYLNEQTKSLRAMGESIVKKMGGSASQAEKDAVGAAINDARISMLEAHRAATEVAYDEASKLIRGDLTAPADDLLGRSVELSKEGNFSPAVKQIFEDITGKRVGFKAPIEIPGAPAEMQAAAQAAREPFKIGKPSGVTASRQALVGQEERLVGSEVSGRTLGPIGAEVSGRPAIPGATAQQMPETIPGIIQNFDIEGRKIAPSITYENLNALRKRVGAMLTPGRRGEAFLNDSEERAMRQLYSAIIQQEDKFASMEGGKAMMDAIKFARDMSKKGIEQQKSDLFRMMRSNMKEGGKGGEGIYKAITSQPHLARYAMKVLPRAEKEMLQERFLAEALDAATSESDEAIRAGAMKSIRFMERKKDIAAAILSPAQQAALKDFSVVVKGTGTALRAPGYQGSSAVNATAATFLAIGTAAAEGGVGAAFKTAVATIGGAKALLKFYMSDEGRRLMMQGVRIPANSPKAAEWSARALAYGTAKGIFPKEQKK